MTQPDSLGGLNHHNSHAYYGTICPVRCDLADKRTARTTITPRRFLGAAMIDHRPAVIAKHLNTTTAVVQAYIDSLPAEEWRAAARIIARG
jgi:hypothetical protein